ncbi:MAG: hypothetical protein Q4C46_06270 [Bacillota bacterium]|nr:hypothetical protein [Bacillota bacterium]
MEDDQEEGIDEIVPMMGSGDDMAAAEEFAAEVEGAGAISEIVEID